MPQIQTRCQYDPLGGFRHIGRVALQRWLAGSILTAFACCTTNGNILIAQSRLGSAPEEDVRVYWPRLDFVIPFNVELTGQTPREIQLEYSENGGSNWSLYSRGDVRTKQFQFIAQTDGEYKFRLKTLDSQGRSFDNPGEPLCVVVDTNKPTANLMIDIDQRGMMLAEFEISDAALDAASVQLTYQTEALPQPREIEFQLSPGREKGSWFGTASWSIPNGTRQLAVRLIAKDKAGNTVEVNRLPQLPRSAAVSNSLQLASGKTRDSRNATANDLAQSQPIGTGIAAPWNAPSPKSDVLSVPGASRAGNAGTDRSTATLFGTGPNGVRATDRVAVSGLDKTSQSKEQTIIPTDRPYPNAPSMDGTFARSDARSSKLPVREMTEEEYEQALASKNISLIAKRGEQSLIVRDSNVEPVKVSTTQLEIEPKVDRIAGQSTFRNNIKPLFSSSKTFSLDYSIENEPESPISSVELWGTTDEGQTWQIWGQDPDRASPFDIQVEAEGLFGFRMIIVGANGLASNRPRNGDNADAWIQVDTTQPQAKLISALYGKGQQAGSMVIEYRATDDYFPERPITLSYSEVPSGPWKTIATGVRNNSRYVWPADPSLPATIYLRLEAFDSAGNVGVHVLDTPIDVQGLAPRGRIQGFRPIQ